MSITDWNYIDSLAKKSLEGDQNAYREFLMFISQYVKYKIFKAIPESRREDVLQEVLLGIHKSLKTLDTSVSCRSWINAIAHYKVSDELRKIYNHKNHEVIEDIAHSEKDNVEMKQYLNHVTNPLNENEKSILIKLKIEGYSISEVSKDLGLSESNIKVISFRALKKIREFIAKEEFYE